MASTLKHSPKQQKFNSATARTNKSKPMLIQVNRCKLIKLDISNKQRLRDTMWFLLYFPVQWQSRWLWHTKNRICTCRKNRWRFFYCNGLTAISTLREIGHTLRKIPVINRQSTLAAIDNSCYQFMWIRFENATINHVYVCQANRYKRYRNWNQQQSYS